MNQIDWHKINRVLVIKFRHHGDVLLTSPVFNTIKNHFPDIEVDALVYADTAPMLEGLPALSELFCVDRKWKKQGTKHQVRQEMNLISRLKARRYNLVIHLTEHWRGATLCRLLNPTYSVVAKYPNRQNKFWKNSFSHHYPTPKKPYHTVEKHLDALRHLGLFPETDDDTRTTFSIDHETSKHTDMLLKEHGLSSGQYILLHPTSRWLFKCWKEAYVAELIDSLQNKGLPVIVTSSPDKGEMDMVARILSMCKTSPINIAGQTSLKLLGGLIRESCLFFGVDSVPMHMAAALQKNVTVLFGPSGELEWGPWKTESDVLVANATCRPCGLDGCGGSKRSQCLYDITPQQALNSIQNLLSKSQQTVSIELEAV